MRKIENKVESKKRGQNIESMKIRGRKRRRVRLQCIRKTREKD